ncbi:hypothetical protein L209DRAFT_13225 [Thermothelomyces heterothallicus CBS 203.75]
MVMTNPGSTAAREITPAGASLEREMCGQRNKPSVLTRRGTVKSRIFINGEFNPKTCSWIDKNTGQYPGGRSCNRRVEPPSLGRRAAISVPVRLGRLPASCAAHNTPDEPDDSTTGLLPSTGRVVLCLLPKPPLTVRRSQKRPYTVEATSEEILPAVDVLAFR